MVRVIRGKEIVRVHVMACACYVCMWSCEIVRLTLGVTLESHQTNGAACLTALCTLLSIWCPQTTQTTDSCDGGRVCRPLIICDDGVPRVATSHINRLKAGEWGFSDFLKRGE